MKSVRVYKSGWNKYALLAGPFWYFTRAMYLKAGLMLLISAATLGIGAIPVWIYCGYRGNADFYQHLKKRQININ